MAINKTRNEQSRPVNFLESKGFGLVYAWCAVGILLATTIVWSALGAHVQQSNADQLVDSYMISDPGTFHDAVFPGAHTFLFKWPLFAAIQFFGASQLAFIVATMLVTLVTVGTLAFVLFKIDRRPLLFGTLCLVLASTLLLVPTQPYPGALLPVNMAMLTTRNLEYVLYLGVLVLFIRSTGVKNWRFWLGTSLLTLLGVSDKLFLIISIGGAVLGLLVYALARHTKHLQMAARWLLASGIALVAATLLLFIIDGHLTHLADAGSVVPYSSAHDLKGFAKAIVYSVVSIFTNLGANPAFDTTTLKEMPAHALTNLLSFGGLGFVLNALVLAVGSWAAAVVTFRTFRKQHATIDVASMLTVMLVWSTLAAIAAFILSAHYYPVDARYVAIVVFALFVAIATWVRTVTITPQRLSIAGGVIVAVILLAVPAVFMAHHADTEAMAKINDRNRLIAQALQHHQVDALVGDYWRVVPIKLQAQNNTNILPLGSCNAPQVALTSNSWQIDLNKHSFAYLLTLDGAALAGYTNCTLDQTVAAYGRPNSSALIAGTLANPAELLLFYDKGAHKSSPTNVASSPPTATVLPIQPEQLPFKTCDGPTDMNIVAHQDDDLLFMNPDLLHAIRADHCIRTIYTTAGDAGGESYYWTSRERGAEAAYSKMIGSDAVWIERIVQLGDHQYVTVANPKGNSKISLVFMHLPDGSPSGRGFAASHDESLEKLDAGKITTIHSVDHQSEYSAPQLVNALTKLMQVYQPASIRTQSNFIGSKYTDHSDHMATGRFAKKAHDQYQKQQFNDLVTIPLTFYEGYPIHEQPENVQGQELADKAAIFLTYSAFDGGACQSMQQCDSKTVYGAYLRRQYIRGN